MIEYCGASLSNFPDLLTYMKEQTIFFYKYMKEKTLTTSFRETPICFPYYVKWNLYLEGKKSKKQKQKGGNQCPQNIYWKAPPMKNNKDNCISDSKRLRTSIKHKKEPENQNNRCAKTHSNKAIKKPNLSYLNDVSLPWNTCYSSPTRCTTSNKKKCSPRN